jgi:integrase
MPERYSTRASYLSVVKNHIRPQSGDLDLDKIKPRAVEHRLAGLPLAAKTQTHIRGLMRSIFECAERWELIEMGKNPIDRVQVKGGSKRPSRPGSLTHAEFWKLLDHIPERFRTMVTVALCLGLRVSEIMGLSVGGSRLCRKHGFGAEKRRSRSSG